MFIGFNWFRIWTSGELLRIWYGNKSTGYLKAGNFLMRFATVKRTPALWN